MSRSFHVEEDTSPEQQTLNQLDQNMKNKLSSQEQDSESEQQKESFALTEHKKRIEYTIQQRRKYMLEIDNQNNRIDNQRNRNKWGNYLVIYEKESYSITLGPDYWCFLPTFICFLAVSLAIFILVINNTTSLVNRALCGLVCGFQLLAYLLVATSDPGRAEQKYQKQFNLNTFQQMKHQQSQKFCKVCLFRVPKSSYHCRDCDICIVGYDHHCPWTSKCIGHNNLSRFYFFLLMTPIFLIYVSVAFIMIMGQQTQAFRIQNIRKLFQF